jgi:proline iminopeptidase
MMKIIKTLGKIILGIVAGLVTLFALGYVLTIGEYTVPETVAQDPSLPYVIIAGVTYHAETFGDPSNPVVITIHGGPGSDYRSILPLQALADEYYVVFFDQRGSGLSPRVSQEEITLASAIADLDSIVDRFGNGEQVNLIGHSWGAMLASAYLGQHPDKVDHAILAEAGFLTSEFAEEWAEETKMSTSKELLYYFLKTKFESLHVTKPDEHAANDYFSHKFNLYPGSDHPQIGYYCAGDVPDPDGSWRFSTQASDDLFQEAVDADGNFDINLAKGVENFSNTVLFMTGECQTMIGADFQSRQMELFPNAELVVIPDAGHEMFSENSETSIAVVRKYMNAPSSE